MSVNIPGMEEIWCTESHFSVMYACIDRSFVNVVYALLNEVVNQKLWTNMAHILYIDTIYQNLGSHKNELQQPIQYVIWHSFYAEINQICINSYKGKKHCQIGHFCLFVKDKPKRHQNSSI